MEHQVSKLVMLLRETRKEAKTTQGQRKCECKTGCIAAEICTR